jgi:hypothetical protein
MNYGLFIAEKEMELAEFQSGSEEGRYSALVRLGKGYGWSIAPNVGKSFR